jgi:hypothetical protein
MSFLISFWLVVMSLLIASWPALISDLIACNWSIIICSAGFILAASNTSCDVITVHTAGSLKMDLFGSTNIVAITNIIKINYPGLLRQNTLEQHHW